MKRPRPMYVELAQLLVARKNCERAGNAEWLGKHSERIAALVERMPHGSGFDAGTTLDMERSGEAILVFNTSFHHVDENGSYDGWTGHRVTVLPSLAFGVQIRVSGQDRNDIKSYISECFHQALTTEVDAS